MASRPLIALLGLAGRPGSALKDYLERRGYDVRTADGEWEVDSVFSARVDVAVADLGADGLGHLRRRGGDNGPLFIMLGGTGQMVDRVLALELGAADVVDPAVPDRELAARIAGLLTRRGRQAADLVVLENSTVDLRAALVMHRSGQEEALSPGQVALLRLFASSPRKVLTRDDIMAEAPAETTDAFDRSIDSRIVRLRRKLDTESIATIRGAGYRFDPPGQS
ncbi:MAG: response regulator transcription factor [Rhizobiaceae bacterium]|nr:response regulator transcription factor [Rhizobiaceae bacterium]